MCVRVCVCMCVCGTVFALLDNTERLRDHRNIVSRQLRYVTCSEGNTTSTHPSLSLSLLSLPLNRNCTTTHTHTHKHTHTHTHTHVRTRTHTHTHSHTTESTLSPVSLKSSGESAHAAENYIEVILVKSNNSKWMCPYTQSAIFQNKHQIGILGQQFSNLAGLIFWTSPNCSLCMHNRSH